MATGAQASGRLPRVVVSLVLCVEAAALALWAVVLAVETAVSAPADRVGSAFLVLVVLAVVAGLLAVARGVGAGRRWSRSPAIVWQLIQALVGVQFAQGAATTAQVRWQWAVAIPLIGAAVVVVLGIMRPGVVTEPDRQF